MNSGKTPSAPPLETEGPIEQQRVSVIPLQGGNPGQNITQDLPPPPYQEAVNYPAPPYPNYEPNNFPNANHANQNAGQQQIYPPYPNYVLGANGAQVQTIYAQPNANPPITTTHVHHTTVVSPPRRHPCSFCSGSVESETDICCLLCLILAAIFTFPFGLILLFCFPCTIRRRCNTCRRLYD